MYHSLVAFLTCLLSQCAARPAANGVASPFGSAIPSNGLPLQDLPAIAMDSSPAGNLKLPLSFDRNIQASFTPGSGNLPKGGMSVVSLAYEIYWYWRDDSTIPFHRTFDRHKWPFEDFYYTVSPSNYPGLSLTPLKTGIAYSKALWSLVRLGWWPRVFEIEISERPSGLGLGTLSVKYEPSHGADKAALNTVVQPSVSKALEETLRVNSTFNSLLSRLSNENTSTPTEAMIPDRLMEQRWYLCWTQLFRFIITRSTFGHVVDTFAPRPVPLRSYCDVSPSRTTRDETSLTFYGPAADPRHRFTWQKLADEVLIWGGMIIDGSLYSTMLYVKDGATTLATLSISIKDP
ncbi:MAG: hypothetical protein L6R41_004837 [Letrouitia leprolyta]|nr:MAG: hypothetical protein L6R41_004837 [Letrouitia leprolyta]